MSSELITCYSCDGSGDIVFPAIDLPDGTFLKEIRRACLNCGGTGHFRMTTDGITYTKRKEHERSRTQDKS